MIKSFVRYGKNVAFNFKYRLSSADVDEKHEQQLSRVKSAFDRKGYANIYFIVNSLQAWKTDNLYWEFVKDKAFKPIIVIVPSTVNAGASAHSLYMHFKNNGYNVIKAFNDSRQPTNIIADLEPGVYFYGDPYNNMAPYHFTVPIKNNIACYVPYFFMPTTHVGGLTQIPNSQSYK